MNDGYACAKYRYTLFSNFTIFTFSLWYYLFTWSFKPISKTVVLTMCFHIQSRLSERGTFPLGSTGILPVKQCKKIIRLYTTEHSYNSNHFCSISFTCYNNISQVTLTLMFICAVTIFVILHPDWPTNTYKAIHWLQ